MPELNDGFGATAPRALCEAVLAHRADLGVALDGDADRIQMVDAEGNLYDGDQLLFAIVKSRARTVPVKGVAGTLMTNLALEHALGKLGVAFGRAAVGDRYVVEMMNEKGWLYGGENSGHILALDRHTTGDGTVAALQVLAAMRESGGALKELLGSLVLYPQKLINVVVSKSFPWKDDPRIAKALSEVETRMAGGAGCCCVLPEPSRYCASWSRVKMPSRSGLPSSSPLWCARRLSEVESSG